MKVTRNIDTGDEKQTIRTISTKPKEHFEGRWKSGRLYPLYSVVVNNGTTFISQNAKMKEEPYVIYDADKKEFKAPDGWLIKEMSADSRVTALGGGGEGGVTPEEVEEMIKDKVDKVNGKGLSTNDYDNTEKDKVASAYQKPNNGIPKSDLAKAVQDVLDGADGAYKKPVTGIPFADLADGVQDSLSNADEAKAGLAGKQDTISDLSTIRSGAAAGATSVQPAEFNELKDEVDTIGNGAYEEAWDGDSTPVVADIPAGVVVTYSSASYTGTLAASASTVDKIYLVSDGNGNYDRYTTVEANGAYSWKKVGSTAIPLSNYATKTQVNQLEAEINGVETNYVASEKVNVDGTFSLDTTRFRTKNHIPVSQGDSILWVGGGSYLCVYDANGTKLDHWSVRSVPIQLTGSTYANAAYMMASFENSEKDVAALKVNGEVVFTPIDAISGIAERTSALETNMEAVERGIEAVERDVDLLDKNGETIEGIVHSNFKVWNYYDYSKENAGESLLSTVYIPIPRWAKYFLQTYSVYNLYGYLGFNFYDATKQLLKTVTYATDGVVRYLDGQRSCGIGFPIPTGSVYVKLSRVSTTALFENMTAKFFSSSSEIRSSIDLAYHAFSSAHLLELDSGGSEDIVNSLTNVVDKNLVKENYYNYQEEKTPSTQAEGVSSVKISIPSWATYVIVGNTANYGYIKYYCYDQSDNLLAEMKYNDTGVNRHDYWEAARGGYYYLGSEIPEGTAYIKIGYISVGSFLLETACVKFYKSSSDVPENYMPNPYKTYQERNIPALNEYTKTNNWHFGGELPDYYFPYLSNKAAEIETYLKTCASNCDVFFFITDTHFDFSRRGPNELNAGWSFAMMSYLRKYLRIDTVLHGGDLMNLPLCGNFMEDYKQVIGTNQVYLALGNHEFISLQDQNAVNYYTRMLSNGMIYGDENKMWGYIDNPTRKSRYIVLSPFGPSPDGTSPYVMDKLNDDNQYNWFVNTALNIPAGYTAVIVSHLLYTLSGYVGSSLILPTPSERYVNAIDNYSGAGRIACVLIGHTHSDRMHIGQSGIPYIISQTDRFYTPGGDHDDIGVTRTRGTTTEQHFEVVVINKVAHEIKLFAIGSNSLDGMDNNLGVEVSARALSNLTNI